MTSTEYSKGYMAGLADAQKQHLSGLTGKPVLKKVRMQCPVCKMDSPLPDPDAELFEAAKAWLNDDIDDGEYADTLRSIIAKVEGRA